MPVDLVKLRERVAWYQRQLTQSDLQPVIDVDDLGELLDEIEALQTRIKNLTPPDPPIAIGAKVRTRNDITFDRCVPAGTVFAVDEAHWTYKQDGVDIFIYSGEVTTFDGAKISVSYYSDEVEVLADA